MIWWIAVIYGVVQGLTEFLPVSSSGHLALIPHFFKVADPGVFFDLTMHIGTAFAIMVYFLKDIILLLNAAVTFLRFPQRKWTREQWLLVNMILATFMTVLLALVFKDLSERYGRSPLIIAFNLAFFGILMWWTDAHATKQGSGVFDGVLVKKKGISYAFLIGVFQALALFPGVSRSGATLTIARKLNLSREESAHFSFLLSLPLIWAGFFYKAYESLSIEGSYDVQGLALGGVISFIVGLATIHFFLKFITKIGLMWFGIYRILFAFFIVTLYYLGVIN